MFLQDSVCCRELEEPRFSFKRKDAGKNGFNPGLIFRSMNFKYGEQIVSKGDRNGWVGRILPGERLQASLPSPPVDIGQEASSFPGKPGDSNLCFFCREEETRFPRRREPAMSNSTGGGLSRISRLLMR